jgi:alanyl-tRNA synthetase
MSSGKELRQGFIDYFVKNGHTRVASSSLVPQNDPTLLFVNAGMVQFKDVFVGVEERPYRRAVTAQKCLRLSGKQNDLEIVGHTARHHTFFEMLGNFSFGDYFKSDAIAYAWEFLTKTIGLAPERMVVTVFGGDPKEPSVPSDEEARTIWSRVTGFPEERIIGLGLKDNFWEMGETGPCGPCSEIHYFMGNDPDLSLFGSEPTAEGRGWTEVWNLVFMQFERFKEGTMRPLPRPSIDTGMGLERLTMVVQGVKSNYETDLMFPLIQKAQELSGKAYGAERTSDVSMNILADHARAVTFLLGDGILPSNVGQGYILRKVLRRALRHGRLLGLHDPFFTQFTETVADMFGDAYPAVREGRQKIARIVHAEELRFAKALDKGMDLLGELLKKLEERGETVVPGSDVFRLYDTFGFPLDLVEQSAAERGLIVDVREFDAEMDQQKAKAREAWTAVSKVDPVYRNVVSGLPATVFLGYDTVDAESEVLAIMSRGQPGTELPMGASGEVVLHRTPFYAEAGGQVGDTGLLVWEGGEARVTDTRSKIPGYHFHAVEVTQGTLRVGVRLQAVVDRLRRDKIRLNHTATHLLHAALREILGEHVKQKGSLVAPDRLRFDFTHFAPLDAEEIERIEELTNRKIRENIEVLTDVMDLDQALRCGAMALFEEKYGDRVRVLRVGDFSTELCGGTHVTRSGDIGLFKIVSEEGISSGVRRLEAVTGPGAVTRVQQDATILDELGRRLNAGRPQLGERLDVLLSQLRAHEKEIERLRHRLASGTAAASERTIQVDGVQVISRTVEELSGASLKSLADELRSQLKSAVVLLANRQADRVDLVVAVTKDLAPRLDASAILQAVARPLGGKGGGRRDFAQGAGREVQRLEEAFEAGIEKVRAQLS